MPDHDTTASALHVERDGQDGADPDDPILRKARQWGSTEGPDFESFPETLDAARAANPHLVDYLDTWLAAGNDAPDYMAVVPHTVSQIESPNILYPVGDPVYIHIWTKPGGEVMYTAVEPVLDEDGFTALDATKQVVFRKALYLSPPRDEFELSRILLELYEHTVHEGDEIKLPKAKGDEDHQAEQEGAVEMMKELLEELKPSIVLPAALRKGVEYRLLRDIVGNGPIEPVMRDPYIEDIHSVGVDHCFTIHKYFGMIKSNIRFDDEHHVEKYLENLAERIGRPVSESRPIVDATLRDNSRINIIYSDSVSRRGPSFSIRRVSTDPVPVTRLIQWGTLSAQMAAYIWICLNNHMSIFFCGEAACGKTMTLNAALAFVHADSKIYTAEDTPEVTPPHQVWQRLITRESGPEEGRVGMFDLLKAALRSRPNYIVVGEIRGAEGNVAFQAMQTGHPVVASFHAASVTKMIQRLTSAPIHVPLTFMDNLNVAVIQQAIKVGNRIIRRVTNIEEIEGYSEFDGGILTRPVFAYDPVTDRHVFRGRNNSHILEKKIASILGYPDPRQIYNDLDERAAVLQALVDQEVFDYAEVNHYMELYLEKGLAGLPFRI